MAVFRRVRDEIRDCLIPVLRARSAGEPGIAEVDEAVDGGSAGAKGPLFRFFSDDHRRLGALLERATVTPGRIDLGPFGEFRAGILRHIAMEEKVLIPAARRARGGEPLPIAAKLRVDHGAIAALLVPTPTPAIVEDLRSVLEPHNRREEEAGGLYEACDEAVGGKEAQRLVDELRRFPAVPLNPYNDGPLVMAHVREALELARREWQG